MPASQRLSPPDTPSPAPKWTHCYCNSHLSCSQKACGVKAAYALTRRGRCEMVCVIAKIDHIMCSFIHQYQPKNSTPSLWRIIRDTSQRTNDIIKSIYTCNIVPTTPRKNEPNQKYNQPREVNECQPASQPQLWPYQTLPLAVTRHSLSIHASDELTVAIATTYAEWTLLSVFCVLCLQSV